MAQKAVFVLNRANFRSQVLKSPDLQRQIMEAAQRVAGDDVEVEAHDGKNRSGAALFCPAAKEARSGTLTQAVGRLSI